MKPKDLLTRKITAIELEVCERTVDRLRQIGALPWLDLAGGRGKKPIVRFRRADVEAMKNRTLGGFDK